MVVQGEPRGLTPARGLRSGGPPGPHCTPRQPGQQAAPEPSARAVTEVGGSAVAPHQARGPDGSCCLLAGPGGWVDGNVRPHGDGTSLMASPAWPAEWPPQTTGRWGWFSRESGPVVPLSCPQTRDDLSWVGQPQRRLACPGSPPPGRGLLPPHGALQGFGVAGPLRRGCVGGPKAPMASGRWSSDLRGGTHITPRGK